MICEYFAAAVNALRQMECEPYCVSTNRLEVNYISIVCILSKINENLILAIVEMEIIL